MGGVTWLCTQAGSCDPHTQTGPALRSPATVEEEAATCCSSLDTAAAAAAVVAADDDAAERGSVVTVRLDVETRHSAPGSCLACWSILSGMLSKETDARSPSPLSPNQRMPSSP